MSASHSYRTTHEAGDFARQLAEPVIRVKSVRAPLFQSASLICFPSAGFSIRRRAPRKRAYSPYRPPSRVSISSHRRPLSRSSLESWESLKLDKSAIQSPHREAKTTNRSPTRAYRRKSSKYEYYKNSASLQTSASSFRSVLALKGKPEKLLPCALRPCRESQRETRVKGFSSTKTRNSECGSNTDV